MLYILIRAKLGEGISWVGPTSGNDLLLSSLIDKVILGISLTMLPEPCAYYLLIILYYSICKAPKAKQ